MSQAETTADDLANVTVRGWQPTRSLTELATAPSIQRERSIKRSLT